MITFDIIEFFGNCDLNEEEQTSLIITHFDDFSDSGKTRIIFALYLSGFYNIIDECNLIK